MSDIYNEEFNMMEEEMTGKDVDAIEEVVDVDCEEEQDDDVTKEELDNVEPYLESKVKECDSLQVYLMQIKAYPLMTPEEERECAKLVMEGDKDAREKMINSNLRFVVAKAIKFLNKGVEMNDLIQEGNVGLIKAVERFDYRVGTRFTTYAGYWVRQALELAVADISKSSSVPKKTISRFKTSVKKAYKNNPDLEDYPTANMIAKEMGTTPKNVESIFRAIQEPVQLDAPVKDGEETKYYEIIEDNASEDAMDALVRLDKKKVVDECLLKLPRKDRIAVKLLTGYADGVEHSADEIGKEYGVTRERVRQIIEGAFSRFEEMTPEFIKAEYSVPENAELGGIN